MTEDASLDDFLDAGREAVESDEEDGGAGEDVDSRSGEGVEDSDGTTDPSEEPESEEPSDVTPATGVCEVHPDGAACVACDATVVRRWRDDGDLVCSDCKGW